MLCLKKRRTYSFTQGACKDLPRRSTKEKNGYNEALNIAVTTLPRKHRSREERSSAGGMVLTVTEDTPADMLAGSMELLVQLPRDHHLHTQRVTVPRSTPMMDLLVQIATAHKLAVSSYTLQAIGERGLVLPHQPNTPIGALDALQVKLLPKQGTFVPRKAKQANQPFETTFRLQVLLPRNQLYVSRVSPKMNLGKILEEVCREKNLDKNKYELRHPANLEETLDLSLSLQDYHLQEVTLYAKQGRTLGAALSSQDIMALQRQEERRRQQAKQSVFGFIFRKSKESSLSIDSLGGRSVSPARSDETGRSVSPLAPPSRPQRKRRPAPKPPVQTSQSTRASVETNDGGEESREKQLVISHSRNSSDSSGYHEASVLSDNPDSNARIPETLPRRSRPPCKLETSRKLGQTSQASKSLGNLATASGGLSHGISSTSISSTGTRKKRAAPPPPQPMARPLSSAISTQALERIVDSEESLTSDIDISKSPSDIAASSKANSDIGVDSKANSDIGVHSLGSKPSSEIGYKIDSEFRAALAGHDDRTVDNNERRAPPAPPPARLKPSLDLTNDFPTPEIISDDTKKVETARVVNREARPPVPKPRSVGASLRPSELQLPLVPRRKVPASDSATTLLRLSNPNDVETHLTETSTDDDGLIDGAEAAENLEAGHSKTTGRDASAEIAHFAKSGYGKRLEARALKHVKSLDDIYSLSMSLDDEEADEETDSKSGSGSSCAVISTIPKCARLTPNNSDDAARIDSEKLAKKLDLPRRVLEAPKRNKIFRSQSETNDFDVNSVEKHPRHLTSHPESFTCAINPNFSGKVANCEAKVAINEKTDVQASRIDGQSEERYESGTAEDYPAFVIVGTNWRGGDDFADAENNDSWAPQVIEEPANADRTTETDILLQKVSATLSNSLPSFEEPPAASPATETSVIVADDVVLDATREESDAKRSGISQDDDESDGLRKKSNISMDPGDGNLPEEPKSRDRFETKTRECLLLEKNVANASTPNATISSQQDTSDYVSATGDDLSITDWEYQLPAPPSAFRDNVSPDFDGYDTITLRSVEAFKEPTAASVAVESRETFEAPVVDSPRRESPVPPAISTEIERLPRAAALKQNVDQPREDPRISQPEKPKQPQMSAESQTAVALKQNVDQPREDPRISQPEKPKQLQTSTESRTSESSSELKKEIINELANKIENGCLPQSNGRITDQESFRRSDVELSAPKIAPADNTLSNFTITTYSRQKSLNIFEEAAEERRSVSQLANSDDKVVKSFATLSRSKSSAQSNFAAGRTFNEAEDDFSSDGKSSVVTRCKSSARSNFATGRTFNEAEDDFSSEGKSSVVTRAQSVEHIVAAAAAADAAEFKRPEAKCLFAQHDSLLRRQSMSNGREKSSVVHRSKSYITLANNSKYREDADGDKRDACCTRDEPDDSRVVKSTSVTNLNQEAQQQQRGNEKFSQWRENILKRQEEPSKEKQLQSLQVLKNILPRLKSTQQSEENVAESMNEKEYSHDTPSKSLPGADTNEPKSNGTTEPEAKPQPEDATTKRYKYAGPPAISLGSWSERPRVNVQLKMDTDYKFGGNNNASGPKTVVNLNRTSCDRSVEDRPKEIIAKAASLKTNGASTITSNGNAANQERRDSQDLLSKKSTNHTIASGFKKPTLNRVGFPEVKITPLRTEDKPIVTSVALKKTSVENNTKKPVENADCRANGQHQPEESLDDDDVKIDTKPVNFKELTKTFGQEVCLRAKPKRVIQSRHSDYYGARPDVSSSFSGAARTSFLDNANRNSSVESARRHVVSNGAQKDAANAPIKRYTSVVGIQSFNNNNYGPENGDTTTKIHGATMKMNGLMPVVKGFKMQADPSESRSSNVLIAHNRVAVVDASKKNVGVPPPPPPTMPVITGVTLKNSTARPKSVPAGNVDTRDQLLESIRSFGGRDKLKSVHS